MNERSTNHNTTKKITMTLTFTVFQGNCISKVSRGTPLTGIAVRVVEAGEAVAGDVITCIRIIWVDVLIALTRLASLPCENKR